MPTWATLSQSVELEDVFEVGEAHRKMCRLLHSLSVASINYSDGWFRTCPAARRSRQYPQPAPGGLFFFREQLTIAGVYYLDGSFSGLLPTP